MINYQVESLIRTLLCYYEPLTRTSGSALVSLGYLGKPIHITVDIGRNFLWRIFSNIEPENHTVYKVKNTLEYVFFFLSQIDI